ncbi:MAG: hypothetical protein K940chlam6_00223 [Chlamydiae bacterium]|nr:hypothetical protein [Chlamydiota bacterium]
MDFPVIISFYTKDTPYEVEVQNLIASCERFSLESSIEGIESQGSWELNCAYKPFFILQKIEELQRPVLWVDADGVFVKNPTVQSAFDADLAVRIEDVPDDHPSKVISSTVFVRPKGKDLIHQWIQNCNDLLLDPKRKEEFWDQIALRNVVLEHSDRILPMPLAYAKIYDHPGDCKQVAMPVIEHYQASRRFKGIMNAQNNN